MSHRRFRLTWVAACIAAGTASAQAPQPAVLGSRSIRVESDELTNTVTLTGTVSTEDEKEQAGRIAVSASPAGNVRNQLEVRQRL